MLKFKRKNKKSEKSDQAINQSDQMLNEHGSAKEKVKNKITYLTRMNSVDLLVDKNYFNFFERLTWFFVITICVLAYVIMSLATSRPNVKFFATDKKGQVTELHAIGTDSDVISNASLQQFVTEAIPTVFTFDFNNYQFVIDHQVPKYFSDEATSKVIALLKDKYIPSLIKDKQFLNISVQSSFIIETGKQYGNDVNEWQIQVPAVVSIYDGRQSQNALVKFQLKVKRSETFKNSYGLEIIELTMKRSRGADYA